VDPLTQMGVIAAAAVVVMVILWFVHLPLGDAGVVDFGWASSLGAAAIFVACTGDGDPVRRALLGLVVGIWAFRLGSHVLVDRVINADEEDGRYRHLRRSLKSHHAGWFLLVFLVQAAFVIVLAVPFVLAANDPRPGPSALDWAALVLWLGGLSLETIADRQLAGFKRDPDSRGRTCRRGLWRYSRHPNYFGEWLMWCSYALLGTRAPEWGWLAWSAPIFMFLLIRFVTGVPPTEAQALRSRGDDYRRYQRETNAVVPWFPRSGDDAEDGTASSPSSQGSSAA